MTDGEAVAGTIVSQAFCSALPVAYRREVPRACWASFAGLILEGAYEATLLAAALNAERGASNIVLLTRVGGGAFGNDPAWIDQAMARAIELVAEYGPDIRIVSRDEPPPSMLTLERSFR